MEWVIVDEIHALAGTKRGAHLALSLERLTAHHAPAAAAHRAVGHATAAVGVAASSAAARHRRGDARPGAAATGDHRGCRRAQAARAPGRRARRRHEPRWASPSRSRRRPAARPPAGEQRTSIWPSVYPAHPGAHPRPPQHHRVRQQPAARGAARAQAQRAGGRGPGPGASRLARARAAAGHRGDAQGGPAAGARGHQLARAGHRHGRGRPRHPGRVAAVGRARAAADRAGRPPGRRAVQGRHLPQVPRRPARVRRGHAADARGRHRADGRAAQPARRAGAADRRRLRRPAVDRGRAVSPWSAAPRTTPSWAASRSRRSWACSPGSTPATSSRSCGRASSGTAPRAPSESRGDARTVAVTPAAPSPIAACSRCSSPTTRPDRGRRPGTRARAARTGGRRVGELDEEMVYEAREGEVILLGASAWRIESIGHDRVLVSPAPGEPGKVPFWKGDGVGRPVELGRALGAFTREMGELAASGTRGQEQALAQLARATTTSTRSRRQPARLPRGGARASTGALPTDRTIVLQRFRDELGDWRVCLLSPFGARVHAPWALAIEARLRERLGVEVQPIWSDDGIVVRLPSAEERVDWSGADGRMPWALARAGVASRRPRRRPCSSPPDEVEELVVQRGRLVRAVRQPLPGERRTRAAAATSPARQPDARCGRCASGRRSCWRSPVALRLVPDHPRDLPRVPPGRVRPARAAGDPGGHRAARGPGRERRDASGPRRSRARCCSTTSRPTCTRAMRPWSTGGRRRWRSTGTCCASSWVPRSCESCSTPTPWSSSSWSSRR